MQIDGYEFAFASSIDPYLNPDGTLVLENPYRLYNNVRNLELHNYGTGPFVRLRLSPPPPNEMGVYAVVRDGVQVMYVGQSANSVRQRWRGGASKISPRNCFKGGQSTNCHLNTQIHQDVVDGHRLELYVLLTPDFDLVETALIAKFQPLWNVKGIKYKV